MKILAVVLIWVLACFAHAALAEDAFQKFEQWDKEALASPFGSPSPDDGVLTSGDIGPGRKAGGLIGFIITCLMVLICLCFMIPLCIKWVVLTLRKLIKSKM